MAAKRKILPLDLHCAERLIHDIESSTFVDLSQAERRIIESCKAGGGRVALSLKKDPHSIRSPSDKALDSHRVLCPSNAATHGSNLADRRNFTCVKDTMHLITHQVLAFVEFKPGYVAKNESAWNQEFYCPRDGHFEPRRQNSQADRCEITEHGWYLRKPTLIMTKDLSHLEDSMPSRSPNLLREAPLPIGPLEAIGTNMADKCKALLSPKLLGSNVWKAGAKEVDKPLLRAQRVSPPGKPRSNHQCSLLAPSTARPALPNELLIQVVKILGGGHYQGERRAIESVKGDGEVELAWLRAIEVGRPMVCFKRLIGRLPDLGPKSNSLSTIPHVSKTPWALMAPATAETKSSRIHREQAGSMPPSAKKTPTQTQSSEVYRRH